MDPVEDVPGIQRLPVNLVEFDKDNWHFKFTKSHILSSKCTGGGEGECSPSKEGGMCPFCDFTQNLQLPHLPDMVFSSNVFTVSNSQRNCVLEFKAFDALSHVSNGQQTVEIACSQKWKDYSQETGYTEKVLKPFDWTFSTDYKGSLKGDWAVEASDIRINVEKLKQKDAILFFHELTLFEDELHDNGIAQLSIKVRVMPGVFFILMRYFLRVDNVLMKINDTRFYHEFDSDYIIREFTSREAKIPELKVPPHLLLDPNEMAPRLPLLKEVNEKLTMVS